MRAGWLDTVGPLQKQKGNAELMDEFFPDIPKTGLAELNRHMMLIVNFYEHKEGEKNFRFSAKAFRERLENQEDHIFTMNGYIDFLKNGLEMDMLTGYHMYLDAEMSKATAELMEYFQGIMAKKDDYPIEAIKALGQNISSVENSVRFLIDKEMNNIRVRLGFKDPEPAETANSLYSRFKKGLLSIIPA